MTRTYFSKAQAERFAAALIKQGYKAQIWTGRDGFGQTQYTVKW